MYSYVYLGRHTFPYTDLTVEIKWNNFEMSKFCLPARVTISPRSHPQHPGHRTPHLTHKHKAVQCHTHGPNIQRLPEKESSVWGGSKGHNLLSPIQIQSSSFPLWGSSSFWLLSPWEFEWGCSCPSTHISLSIWFTPGQWKQYSPQAGLAHDPKLSNQSNTSSGTKWLVRGWVYDPHWASYSQS